MGIFNYFIYCFKHYADFKGRARRKEYWSFYLLNSIIPTILYIPMIIGLDNMTYSYSYSDFYLEEYINSERIIPSMDMLFTVSIILISIYYLVTLLPSLAVSVRRLHDINKDWDNIFIGFIPFIGAIILLIWSLKEGDRGTNDYGPDPKMDLTNPQTDTPESLVECPSCKRLISKDSAYCEYCGTNMKIQIVVCPACKRTNDIDATFCKWCGTRIKVSKPTMF